MAAAANPSEYRILKPAAFIRRHSLDRLAGELFVMGFQGYAVAESYRRLVRDHGIGGTILFRHNIQTPEQVLELNREIRSLHPAALPPVISVDQEAGLVTRLQKPFTEWTGNLSIARAAEKLNRPGLAREVGRAIGLELAATGFNTDFAPVVDVNSNPRNPIIGPRSFGDRPGPVGRLGAEFIAGMQSAGVAACAKHFPGHGDTAQDSHIALPVVDRPASSLARTEWPPFRDAVLAGVASMMTAHVVFPAIDPGVPATVSRKIQQDILRNGLGFRGVVFTDDLNMAGIAKDRPPERIAVDCLKAGCDILLVCHNYEKQPLFIEGVRKAIRDGELSERQVKRALRRVLQFKHRYCREPARPVPLTVVGSDAHQKLSALIREHGGDPLKGMKDPTTAAAPGA